MTLRAAILRPATKLTTGRIADTNASWIATSSSSSAWTGSRSSPSGPPDRLAWAWRKAMAEADVVISTGGSG